MWPCAIFYIGDAIAFSNSPKEHMKHFEEVIGLLMAAGMTLKLKKCHFVFQIS